VKRKAIETAKFYFFDTGVVRALRRLPRVVPQQTEWGELFEQFIMMEIKSWLDYFEPLGTLHYWRSTSQFEVDFILNNQFAIEVKSADRISNKHMNGLKALREDNICSAYLIVCIEERPRIEDGIEILPWQTFLEQLWQGRFSQKTKI
jgi:predicted AAA+ superfamily ATPase